MAIDKIPSTKIADELGNVCCTIGFVSFGCGVVFSISVRFN
ncbi:MAG: hypothetical protein U9P82_11970 [Bacteroidota bacterium]|nr:hypothetical protein [Bacteroidota bacterium]